MLDLVDLTSEGELCQAILEAGLAEVDAVTEVSGVLGVEEQGQARHILDLLGVADLNHVLVAGIVVVEDADRLPGVLVVGETRAHGVGLVWAHLAVLEPFFDSAVMVPGVVAG